MTRASLDPRQSGLFNQLRAVVRSNAGVVILLLLGAALRVWAIAAYRPAVLGYPDGTEYLINGVSDLWRNIGRPVGYPLLIRGVTWLSGGLTTLIAVQHLIGMATAVILYAALRIVGAPRGVACLPAAVVLLSGDQVYIEHSPLSEALFGALVALAVALSLRAFSGEDAGRLSRAALLWCAAAGAAVGAASVVRYVGEALVPVFALWMMALGCRGTLAARLCAGAAVCMAAVAVVGGYVAVRGLALRSGGTQGQTGLAVPGNAMYGRVAPFADCERFTPPAGTRPLCDPTPPAQRQGPGWYVFFSASPLHRAPKEASAGSDRFARAALRHQPDSYALAVARDLGRFVAPTGLARPGEGWGDKPSAYRFGQRRAEEARAVEVTSGLFGQTKVELGATVPALDRYQAIVRLHGGLLGLCFVLAVCGLLFARARVLRAILLLLGVTFAALAVPVGVAVYDARYAFPVEGLVAAAAALGAWSLATRLRR